MDNYNLISFGGIFVLVGVAWLFSSHRRELNWRLVCSGIVLQLAIALFIFKVPAGTKIFLWVNEAVIRMLDSATAGSRFLFGPLATPPGGDDSLGFILAFQAFPTIIFFSALIAVLYYLGIMQRVISGFAFCFSKLLRISGAESLVAASNIFVGVETALTIKPYLSRMTHSELCTVLAVGMGTVASNVLALYVFTLQEQFPLIAGHLVSASLLSAPAALVMSKILLPETERSETLGVHVQPYYEKDSNLFAAIIQGSQGGVKMIVGISALLIAVLGLVALLDLALSSMGSLISPKLEGALTLKALCGYLFYPLTLALGVPLEDARLVSQIIGGRLIVTEVVAYQDLAAALAEGRIVHPRSAVITTYALCGFAHLASMAIFVGGVCALAPERTRDMGRVAVRALAAATLACLMTACVAGTFFGSGSILLGE